MTRKNTIWIAVLINAGLLAVLLVAAMTTQEVPSQMVATKKEEIFQLPAFDQEPFAQILPELPKNEGVEPSVVHKLPPLVAEEPVAKEAPSTSEILVKKGDSLEKLARLYHTTIEEIVELNRLPSTFLKIGQMLKIPAGKKKEEPEFYTMKVGENPWAIAIRHHMKVEDLLKLNGLNEEKARKLKPGDRLRVR